MSNETPDERQEEDMRAKATDAPERTAQAPEELTTTFTAGPGGVWTDEVGVITGELELRTRCGRDGRVTVEVRYAEAEEWYRVSAADAQLVDPADHAPLHRSLIGLLHRPLG
ncbi:MAG TPA: hypothetical protein VIL00_15725 [Pseudonocardiaceae bacterium]